MVPGLLPQHLWVLCVGHTASPGARRMLGALPLALHSSKRSWGPAPGTCCKLKCVYPQRHHGAQREGSRPMHEPAAGFPTLSPARQQIQAGLCPSGTFSPTSPGTVQGEVLGCRAVPSPHAPGMLGAIPQFPQTPAGSKLGPSVAGELALDPGSSEAEPTASPVIC